jgi:hypothetical protein
MIKRNSPFSDIIVNGYPAHRVILVEASKTFKDLIESLNDDDIKELNLPYDNDVVDQLLNLIYYAEYKLDIKLYDVIAYMDIKLSKSVDIFKVGSIGDIREILQKYEIDYDVNYDNPSDSDYKFLCCLSHEKFMKLTEPIAKIAFICLPLDNDNIKSLYNDNIKKIGLLYTTISLRCLLPWYKDWHWLYAMYNIAFANAAKSHCKYINASLLHDTKLTNMNLYAIPNGKYTQESLDMTNKCTEILISLGLEKDLFE